MAAAGLIIAFNWSYSDGNRAGYIQKFSKKGWLCKTYEGELAMTTVPGVAPLLWGFSVWDERGIATAAVSLEEPEAQRLASFLAHPAARSLRDRLGSLVTRQAD